MWSKFLDLVWRKHSSFAFQTILLAWGFSYVGYYLGVNYDPLWFARFGSVIVLFGIIAEFILLQNQFSALYSSLNGQGAAVFGGTGIPDLTPSKWKRIQSTLAHFTVISGTLIWGFGDWILIK
jgi:hypothetical protein